MLDRDYIKWGLYGGFILFFLTVIYQIFIFINCTSLGILCLVLGWLLLSPIRKMENLFQIDLPSFWLISISLIFYFILGFLIGIIARRLYLMKYGNE